MRNFRFLSGEYKNVIILLFSGLIFFSCGTYLLVTTSIPGGLIFSGLGLFILGVGLYNLKYKDTSPFGMPYSFKWENLPEWKRFVVFVIFTLFALAFIWLIIESINENFTKIWNAIPGAITLLMIYSGVLLIRKSKS